jgi:hypothetical protein
MTRKIKLSLLVVSVGALQLGGILSAAQAPATPAPAPPSIVGIRPGTPIDEAYKILSQHGSNGMIQFGQKQLDALADKPITYAFVWSTTGSPEDRELIDVDLTFPPSEQKVWRITRRISFPPGQEPTADAMLNSLRKTFGKELPTGVSERAFWAFDTQGRPAQGSGINLADCAQYLDLPDLNNTVLAFASAKTSPNVALAPTVVVANRESCHQFVFVVANLAGASNGGKIRFVSVTITDIGAGIRAGTATQAALNGADLAHQQKALKKAQQQSVPQF